MPIALLSYCPRHFSPCQMSPTALCSDSVMPRQRYAPTALCSDSVMPSVMPSQRYALLALCLAGVMPFCARKIYLNTLYLGRFCMTYALRKSCLHEKRRVCSTNEIRKKKKTRKRQLLVCTKQPIVFKYQPI